MQIHLQQFQGPLDLLLRLIEKEKLDISTISLAGITNQYLEFVDNNKTLAFAELIYFLEIASRLIVLKTKLLLPYLMTKDEEDEIEDLVDRLKQYQQYLEAARKLKHHLDKGEYQSFNRGSNQRNFFGSICPTEEVSLIQLRRMIMRLIKNHPTSSEMPTKLKKLFNIQQRIKMIQDYLRQKNSFQFNELIALSSTKLEIIINFLALLELNKMRVIYLEQKEMLGQITITKQLNESYNITN